MIQINSNKAHYFVAKKVEQRFVNSSPMRSLRVFRLIGLFLTCSHAVHSSPMMSTFVPGHISTSSIHRPHSHGMIGFQTYASNNSEDNKGYDDRFALESQLSQFRIIQQISQDRRSLLRQSILSTSLLPALSIMEGRFSIAKAATGDENNIDFDCLRDLPPITKDCVRVYLCRHGQTENNRLHLVQGARVDPPLNDTGRQQATRLGRALSRLDPSLAPTTIRHSLLQRAKETAHVAVTTYGQEKRKFEGEFPDKEGRILGDNLGDFKVLPSLGEVDFGPLVEGKLSVEVKAKMTKVYAAWSLGLIDEKSEDENGSSGESARDIFLRIENALESLSQQTTTTRSTIFAVSHSTYIRMLLGSLLEIPLAEAALLEQKNGCINVIDINIKGEKKKIGLDSKIFGGSLMLSKEKMNFHVEFPVTHVIRMNENRHLAGLI